MTRAALLGMAAVLLVMVWGAPAQTALPPDAQDQLARVEAYLNSLDTLRSRFTQINPDGGTVTGELYYAAPDKMRLEYDPPSRVLIIADRWQVIYHDRRLGQVSHLLTGSTPLGFLLAENIELAGDVTVTALEDEGGELRVTLVQTEEPNQGRITLVFADQPLELRRWTVVDAQGLATHVVLENVETDVALDEELFIFRNPKFDPRGRD